MMMSFNAGNELDKEIPSLDYSAFLDLHCILMMMMMITIVMMMMMMMMMLMMKIMFHLTI